MKQGSTGFVPERLREGREARGLSVVSLADLLGVSRQAIYQYEGGQQVPRVDVTTKMATTLGLPYGFFFWPVGAEDKSGVLYRSRSSATKAMRLRLRWRYVWLRNIAEYLRGLVQLPAPNIPDIVLPELERVSDTDIENAAAALRRYWDLGPGPISNLTWLLENNGVVVARGKVEADSLDGCSRWHHDYPYIMLSADKESAVRSRSDMGHELFHILARHDPDAPYTTAQRRLMEKQAQHFAGAFLLPAESFASAFYSPSLESLIRLKERWRVSVGMMIARAQELQLMFPEQARRMWINYTRRGYRRGEPLDDRLEIEEPCLLRESFELLVSSERQGREQILADLLYAPRDIEELACLPEGFLTADIRPQVELKPTSAKVVPIRRDKLDDA